VAELEMLLAAPLAGTGSPETALGGTR
jgi:hypothetical protein